jgi:hypothetical protein
MLGFAWLDFGPGERGNTMRKSSLIVERLRGLYGGGHHFHLAKSGSGGALVDIDIPYRQARETADPHREIVV